MPNRQYEEILERIHGLQAQLEQEFDGLVAEKRARFQYSLKKGRVFFNKSVRDFHRHHRTGIWRYLYEAKPIHVLTAPVIYSVIFPFLLIDLFIFIYQQICFRAYGIPLVKRSDYIVIDRHHLCYLNAIEKLNCIYCGYGNGLIEYVGEIIGRTEQYWCPIKHAQRTPNPHKYTEKFVDYGDTKAYQEKLGEFRKELRDKSSNSIT